MVYRDSSIQGNSPHLVVLTRQVRVAEVFFPVKAEKSSVKDARDTVKKNTRLFLIYSERCFIPFMALHMGHRARKKCTIVNGTR